MDKQTVEPDLFDRMQALRFEELSTAEQAEFLTHFALEDYDMVRDTMGESADFLAAEFAAMEVQEAPKKEAQQPAFRLIDLLNYRIPVYQAAIAAGVLLFAIIFINRSEDDILQLNGVPVLADSLHAIPASFADTNHVHQRSKAPMWEGNLSQPVADSAHHKAQHKEGTPSEMKSPNGYPLLEQEALYTHRMWEVRADRVAEQMRETSYYRESLV